MSVDIRPREDWQNPAQPVVGPNMVLGTIELLPAHYTAANTIPDDIPQYLRNIQNDYTVNRGYSIGYNFAIDQTGQAWECRGFDIKCAANKGMNDVTIAVLCLVDGAEAMNPAMVATFTALGAEAQRIVGNLLVVGHRDIGETSCPGDGIYHQVVTGQLEPDTTPTPEPTPPPTQPTEEDDDMAFIIQNTQTGEVALVYGDRQMCGLAGGDLPGYTAKFGDIIPTDPVVWQGFQDKSR